MCADCPYVINGVTVKEDMCDECKILKKYSVKNNVVHKKKSTKMSRRLKRRSHLKKLYEIEVNTRSVWIQRYGKSNSFYVNKSYGRSAWVRYHKRFSNKKVRLYSKTNIPKGNWYRKIFDFWWVIH